MADELKFQHVQPLHYHRDRQIEYFSKVRAAMKQRKVTAVDLAYRCGNSAGHIRKQLRIEYGDAPTLKLARVISSLLGVNP